MADENLLDREGKPVSKGVDILSTFVFCRLYLPV